MQSGDICPPVTPEKTTGSCCVITMELLRLRQENRRLKRQVHELQKAAHQQTEDTLANININELLSNIGPSVCGKMRSCGLQTCQDENHEGDCQDCVILIKTGKKLIWVDI